MSNILWVQTCCAWHGEYAEHPTVDGGVARLKRAPDVDGWSVMLFDASNKAITVDDQGAPAYVPMNEQDAMALLADF